MVENCVFCDIAVGRKPAHFIYKDNHVMVIMNTDPMNKGQSLVIPKKHYEWVYDIPKSLVSYAHGVAQNVAKTSRKTIPGCTGITIMQSNEEGAYAKTPHFHIHVMPRYPKGKDNFKCNPSRHNTTDEELGRLAKELSHNLYKP